MSWSNNNKYRVTGSITSGLALSEVNADGGTIGSIGWTLYDSINYSSGTYSPDTYFEGYYDSGDSVARKVQWTATGSIYYQYATSSDGISYSTWSTLQSAISEKEINISTQYFKFRFIWDGVLWSGSDSVYIYNIQPYFQRFVKGTIIDANSVNGNFSFVGMGNWLPAGGSELVNTTGVYDLGEDIYKWDNAYLNNIEIGNLEIQSGSIINNALFLISEYEINSTTSRIDFSGIEDYNFIKISINGNHFYTSASYFRIYFNQDSATNYGYCKLGVIGSTVQGIYTTSSSGIDMIITYTTATSNKIYFDSYIMTDPGVERVLNFEEITELSGTYIRQTNQCVGVWNNSSDTITSVSIVPATSFPTGLSIKLWGSK